MPLTKASDIAEAEFITTGLFIDKVSGGLPRGKIFELWGDSGVGKSTLALQMVAAAQAQGYKCLWVDFEIYFDPKYAASVGVDTEALDIIRSETAEEGLDELEEAARTGKYDVIVLDAIGALSSRQEQEKQNGERSIGVQASLTSRFLRKIVPIIYHKKTCLLAINHSFTDLMSGALKTSGGKKMEYHRSISVRLKRKPNLVLKEGDRKVGYVIVAECKRNKILNTEGMEAEGQLLMGDGFSKTADLMQDALDKGIIEKRGNTYYMGDEKVAVGIPKLREAFKDEVFAEKIASILA